MSTEAVKIDPQQVEDFVKQAFEENFRRLRFENGHGLTAEVKEAARRHVVLYWRKLRRIAETVTDTEVRLNLPNQETPDKRRFNIEGIVDIVQSDDRTVMYDLKTLDPEYIKSNLSTYRQQLNVYAHIWKNLRGQRLDETAIIATQLPKALDSAYENMDQDPERFRAELEKWDPVIPIQFDDRKVDETVREFGEVVDSIEDGEFEPPPVEKLKKTEVGKEVFATRVCRNCDARFSCVPYQELIRKDKPRELPAYQERFEDNGPEEDLQERLDRGLAS